MKQVLAALALGLVISPVFAQEAAQNNSDAQQAPPPQPPSTNLGQQVSGGPPQVVYPRVEDVIDDTVQGVQDLQLTPNQIRQIKQMWLEQESQKATPYTDPPKPITRTLPLNLDPGVAPPVLRLSMGQQSSVVFSDYDGQPWFITNVSMNRSVFEDGKAGGQTQGENAVPTNILTLSPKAPSAYGNVTVTLKGLSTPVILILTAGQQEVDMRIDAKVPGRNPDAAERVSMLSMPQIDSGLTAFLDGVPPKEAMRLEVTGLDGVDAWLYRQNMYVRAKADAQYPAFTNAARSTSGTSVYRYSGMQSSITFTTGGQAVTVFIEQESGR